MRQTARTKVPFTRVNAKKCLCWQCPVQDDSACVKQSADKMGDVMGTTFFDPETVSGLYCSSGVASCKDIDVSRSCICGDCQVYRDYELARGTPVDHYCGGGSAT